MAKMEVLDFVMKELGDRHRKIRVILPKDYNQNGNKRYPVLYMHDGQNLVDPAAFSGYSWNVSETLDHLQNDGYIDGIIVVGIDSEDRYRIPEYTNAIAKKAEKAVKKLNKGSLFLPEAHLYGKFIVESLKPYIDQNYRTLPDRLNTGLCGSSCGGNVSLYLGTVYNDVFGIIGALSPAYWLVEDDLFQRIKTKEYLEGTKIYHDMGAKEHPFALFNYIRNAKRLAAILDKKQFDDEHHLMVIDRVATHNELFWQSRFPEFIKWAYPKKAL